MEGLSLLIVFILSLMTSSALMGLLIFSPPPSDPGARLFIYPLMPLLCVSLLDFFVILFNNCPGIEAGRTFFMEASSFLRLGLGLGWVIFCQRQYVLHDVLDGSQRLTPFLILLTGLNGGLYVMVNVFFPNFQRIGNAASSLIMSLTAIYAAILAVLILRKTNRLLPSAWAGLILAVIGLTLYPLVFVADVLGYHYPGLDPELPLWLIFNPYFLFIICFILLPKLYRSAPQKVITDTKATSGFTLQSGVDVLSDRETETVMYLEAGLSYKEIAVKMEVSLTTVQTYVLRSYKKLNIQSRKQLHQLIDADDP